MSQRSQEWDSTYRSMDIDGSWMLSIGAHAPYAEPLKEFQDLLTQLTNHDSMTIWRVRKKQTVGLANKNQPQNQWVKGHETESHAFHGTSTRFCGFLNGKMTLCGSELI